jgi:uncharacterized protein (UPF0261 family)
MAKTIAVIGTLDTKGDQIKYIKEKIEGKGHKPLVIDVGVLGQTPFEPDITKNLVAEAAGTTIEDVAAMGPQREADAIMTMAKGVRALLNDLNKKGEIDGVLAAGGSLGTSLALEAISDLPFAMPKIILSTVANSPAINPDQVANNVVMVLWAGGLWGINTFGKSLLDQAAAMIIGSAEAYERDTTTDRKVIGVTSLGMNATRFLFHLRPALMERNYEVAVFHATGMSTRAFEKAVESRSFDFVLDFQAGQELVSEICGSLFSPGPKRLEAAAKSGVPQIVSLGMQEMEMCLWGSYKPIPEHMVDRMTFIHNPILSVIFTNLEEKVNMARLLAKKLNEASGPVTLIVALKPSLGVTKWVPGSAENMEAVRRELRANLKSTVRYEEVNCSTDDKEFSDRVLEIMDEMMDAVK